jgi:RNA-directed DNA polymerase
MNRFNNLYPQIYSIANLQLADARARIGKSEQYGVKLHDRNRADNIQSLHMALRNKTYTTSEYKTFTIYEPKEREISCLPYFPDRIMHHAVMNVVEPIFISAFTANSYSSIKGKGIHGALYALRDALNDVPGTTYCLKLDIKKFYPSISHDIMKNLLRRKFKDNDLLWLLDEVIDSADGLPIGNYLSGFLSNFYLTPFDRWIKERERVKYCFRYADDIVILHRNKDYLHSLLKRIESFLRSELNLHVKSNWQVFPVEKRGIDFVGYVSFHDYALLRKSIKKNFAKRRHNRASVTSYLGWAKHANCKHLVKKLKKDGKF